MFKKMLVALDNSPVGHHVFDESVSLAKVAGASLILLNVVSPFDEYYPNPFLTQPGMNSSIVYAEVVNSYLEQWEGLKQESVNFLKNFCSQAQVFGVKTEFIQNFGDPGRIICDTARHCEADLIILGRRGRKGLSEFFLGSVSNYVLHHASCSVLTVQGPMEETIKSSQNEQVASI